MNSRKGSLQKVIVLLAVASCCKAAAPLASSDEAAIQALLTALPNLKSAAGSATDFCSLTNSRNLSISCSGPSTNPQRVRSLTINRAEGTLDGSVLAPLDNLTSLIIATSPGLTITNAGSWANWTGLSLLTISDAKLTEIPQAWTAAGVWPALQQLIFSNNGLKSLPEGSPGAWPTLNQLSITNNSGIQYIAG
ncbi:hypothetical protein WJX73_007716 [Symbiochloris irregularis]|uniref:Uncharacterized protein n=1 Tax=Symbiochloris irregularis TaxID=706552 RepID=A0AAW1NQ31_9CHLO